MYPVCPHRNVPAAFERFLGPDSGGIERFFPEARAYRLDDTLWEVRRQGRRAALVAREAAILVQTVLVVAGAIAALSMKDYYSTVQERFALLTKLAT